MEICKDCKKQGEWNISIQNGLNHFYLCTECHASRHRAIWFAK